MNGRKLFREFAQSKGREAKSFVNIKKEYYANDLLITRNNNNDLETLSIDYKDMIHWIIKNKKIC